MFKKCKVVMLPTNQKANLALNTTGKLTLSNHYYENSPNFTNQHLYILSDDEIKKDNWVKLYVKHIEKEWIHKVTEQDLIEYPNFNNEGQKIIATTDKSLSIHWNNQDHKSLPQPSQSFIEKYVREYNKDNQITDIMVEYEGYHGINTSIAEVNTISGDGSKDWKGLNDFRDFKLKINPKDNTITIKKVKDTWTRDEVIELIRIFGSSCTPNEFTEKWIEDNL